MIPNATKKIRFFTDLYAWQKAHQLVLSIYKITQSFPRDELFGLSSQIRRSSASVGANIAEGFGRPSLREKIQFYSIAQSSLTETQNHLILSHDLGYIKDAVFHQTFLESQEVSKILQGLISKTRARALSS